MTIRYQALPTEVARYYQRGGTDANGQLPERALSQGQGIPCRHCLKQVPAGQTFLILSHRPFPAPQPYAEQGPIFLCAAECQRGASSAFPAIHSADSYILRGYSSAHRIVYGTGAVVPTDQIASQAAALLTQSEVAYLHVRSAANNCYHLRIERGA